MEVAIPVVALGALYVISNRRKILKCVKRKKSKNYRIHIFHRLIIRFKRMGN